MLSILLNFPVRDLSNIPTCVRYFDNRLSTARMKHKWLIFTLVLFFCFTAQAQQNAKDTSASKVKNIPVTTSLDDLNDVSFDELAAFLDSILSPHSFFLASLQAGNGFYNYSTKTDFQLQTTRKLTYSPLIGYYHKSGLGITGAGYIINDNNNLNLFQAAIAPSYDFLKNKDLATGLSYTRYFTKSSLPFYTSPLQNELSAYFTWRKSWIRPGISANYGWGTRSDYKDREDLLTSMRLRRNGITRINTQESVSDFSVTASLRHDFYWLDVFGKNDHIRFTPQLAFTGGSQQYGFNQTAARDPNIIRPEEAVLYNYNNYNLYDNSSFQPISFALFLKSEYAFGKLFIQPQVMLDYYFPANSNNLNLLFTVNAGVML
jgi:hypothetical protein